MESPVQTAEPTPSSSKSAAIGWMLWPALLLVAGITLLNILYGEHITIREGLGWDGRTYGAVARDPIHTIFVQGMSDYRLVRVFPSLLVHGGLKLLGLPADTPNVVLGFQVYNGLLSLGIVAVWFALARHWQLSRSAVWIGLCALLVNYMALKMTPFYPTLTDHSALLLGLLAVWCFVTHRHGLLLLTLFACAGTWPALLYAGLLLYVFQFRDTRTDTPPDSADITRRPHWFWRSPLPLAATVGFVLLLLYGLFTPKYLLFSRQASKFMLELKEPMNWWLLPVSAALSAGFIHASLKPLLNWPLGGLCRLRHELQPRRILHAVALVAPILIAVFLISASKSHKYTPLSIGLSTLILSTLQPLIFLVAHAVYFGPLVLLTLASWPAIAAAIRTHGYGAVGFTVLALGLSLHPESRLMAGFYPFIVAFTVLTLDRARRLTPAMAIVFIAVSLGLSKFWFPLNVDGQTDMARYMMSIGYEMTPTDYGISVGAVLLAGGLLYAVHRFSSKRTAPSA